MHSQSLAKPSWCSSTTSSVQQLASLGRGDLIAVRTETGASVLSGTGQLTWGSADPHTALARLGEEVLLLEASGGGTLLFSAGGRFRSEDLFYDRAAAGGGSVTQAAASLADGFLALACGRRLLLVDSQQRVQREISLPAGSDVTGLCWAGGRLLACRRGSSTEGILAWSRDDGTAGVLPDSQHGSDFSCLAAAPCGRLVAAGQSDGQVLVWQLEPDARGELIHRLAHNAAVEALTWDAGSQRLAVSDGATVSIWDLGSNDSKDAAAMQPAVVCCGHQRMARITSIAFDTTSPALATGADYGQVLVYDTAAAVAGIPLEPRARTTVSSFADCCRSSVTALAWLPSGALVAGCDDGRVVSWAGLSPAASASSESGSVAAEAPQQAASASKSASGAGAAPPVSSSSSVAAARRSAAAALAAAAQSQAQAQPLPTAPSPAANGVRSFKTLSAPELNGHAAAVDASASQQAEGAFSYAEALCPSPPPTQKGGTASPASSQTGSGESAGEQQRREQSVADAVSALHLGSHPQPAAQHLASPPQTPDPKQRLENGGPSAPVTPAMHQPQPPSTPPTGRSGRSKRGTRRNKSLSQNNLAGGSSEGSGSNPAFQRRRSCNNLANGHYPPSAPATPQGRSPQEAAPPYAGQWSPVSLPLQSAPYGVFFQAPVQMQYHQHSMMMPHMGNHGQSPYIAAMPASPGQVAYMQSSMGPVPVLMPAAMPMPMGTHWAPYPPAATFPQSASHQPPRQGGYAAAQQREWHVHAAYGHGTPPLSPSATSIDFTRLSSSGATAGTPSASAASTNGTAAKQRGSTKRGSRGRGGGAGGKSASPEDSPAELSSDCSSSLKTSTSEQDAAAMEVAVPVTTIYVGNLPPPVDEHMLYTAFSGFGSITACEVVRDRVNGESRGFAFMTFAHASCAASAMVNMNGAVLYGPFSDFALRVAPSARDQQTQAQQASVQSSLRAASAPHICQAPPGAAAQQLPRSRAAAAAAAVDAKRVLEARRRAAAAGSPAAEGQGQGSAGAATEAPGQTSGQPQNGRTLTPEQQEQEQLSAAKQQHAAEQRQQLVERARQVVAQAEQSSASAAAAAQQEPLTQPVTVEQLSAPSEQQQQQQQSASVAAGVTLPAVAEAEEAAIVAACEPAEADSQAEQAGA